MYSPKVREDLVPRLYRLKLRLNRPMTVLVAEAVEAYLLSHSDPDLTATSPTETDQNPPNEKSPSNR